MNGPQTASADVLSVHGLTVDYPDGRRAVDGLDLSVRRGRTVGLLGASGSGKTTAARAILDLLPDGAKVGGTISLGGQDVRALPPRAWRRLRWEDVALVPQAAMNALDPVLRVDRQIAEVVRVHRSVNRRTALQMAHDALEAVGIHRDRASSFPHQFSWGMRQRASIAMATVLEPKLLIADEPTTGLDVVVQDRILELLLEAKIRFDLALVVVTHDLGVANELCDDVVMLDKGRTLASGPAAEVLGEALASRSEARRPNASPPSVPQQLAERRPAALETHDLTVTYQSGRGLAAIQASSTMTAVDRVTLEVAPGEVVGLAGESGCGKSSLVSTLVGLQRPAGGTVAIGGREVATPDRADWSSMRRQVQMIFQDPYESLNPRLSVYDTVREPLAAQRLAEGADVRPRVCEALENAGLSPCEDYLERRPHQLSGGERQRVAIARALVVRPDVILADEPVSMLDERTAEGVVDVLLDLARRLDVGILLVSHDVSLLRRTCDRVAIMYLGRLVEVGPTDQVLGHPSHPYTQALVRAVPSRDPSARRERVLLRGEAPSLQNRPSGCAFHPRCPVATDRCTQDRPELAAQHEAASESSDCSDVACWHPLTHPPHVVAQTTPVHIDHTRGIPTP